MIARLMPVFIVFALTLLFGWLLAVPNEKQITETELRPLPTLELPLLDGATTPLPRGNWLLVNFFASWCVPCVVEHPTLMELKEHLPITGIAYKDQTLMVKALLKDRGNPYAHVFTDSQGLSSVPFGITGVPESFLVNPEGNIVWHHAGPLLNDQLVEIKSVLYGN